MKMKFKEIFFDERKLRNVCDFFAEHVSMRDGEGVRPTTTEELRILSGILYSAMLTIKSHAYEDKWNEIQTVKDMAEFTANQLLPKDINNYISVYLRIDEILENFKLEN